MTKHLSPLDYYYEQCRDHQMVSDDNQLQIMRSLQMVYENLLTEKKRRTSLLGKITKAKLVTGLYLWGGVGVGKTFMMDCFYHSLPFNEKMRMHFHAFMRMIHLELKKYQGGKNPLTIVAKEIAKKKLVLCLDEFVVNDIADAMLLGRLLIALFNEGVCLIATSNITPDDLYRKGLQRALFLPTIALIKEKTQVMHIESIVDYRLRHLRSAGVFHVPNNHIAHEKMEKAFSILSGHAAISHEPVFICDRVIPVIKKTNEAIWFDFNVICNIPRSQHDYLELVNDYNAIFVSNIPVIPSHAKDRISLFIRFVDVIYDARKRLILSAEQTVDFLYTEGQMLFEYGRTKSRLLEMQSESYFQ